MNHQSGTINVILLLCLVVIPHSNSIHDVKIQSNNQRNKPSNLEQFFTRLEPSIKSQMTCTGCKLGAFLLQYSIKSGISNAEIKGRIHKFCAILLIQTPRVCQGVAEVFGDVIIHILRETDLGPSEICSVALSDDCEDTYSFQHEWEVAFPPVNKPPVKPPIPPKNGAPTFKVLHISDTHYDPYYQEGANAECNEPLCCRLINGAPLTSSAAAGRWGDYRKCDTPKRTIINMLKHIQKTHPDINYILWTGDLPAHDIWNQTREGNLNILRETVSQMVKTFPGIPIFPALGNHESAPVDSFAPPFAPEEYRPSWLYDELNEQWKRWLPDSTSNTIRRGAFYSVLIRPNFRIVSINMNYCNNKNWWLLLNSTDPVDELQWLVSVLDKAEIIGEKVHIIGHIPPGHSDCLKVWSKNYYRIINRYESTIVAQFFGHTHYDEFQVFYDTKNLERALSIAYVGPSVSPYYDLNPGYRIYYVDGDHPETTRMVVDHETWIMNLQEANRNNNYPIWQKLYNARQAYGMTSLLPQDWDSLIDKMSNDPTIFNLYYKYYYKNSPVRPQCDNQCRKRLLCDLRSGKSHDKNTLCQRIFMSSRHKSKINNST
ncbi:hypothetical protein PV325_000728, partial [Microctonus aethiopoides]